MKNNLEEEKLTFQEEQHLVHLLSKLSPGILPFSIFKQVARIMVTATQLIVPLIEEEDGLKVVLVRRPNNDPFWPNLLHVPGKIFLATDKDYRSATKRLIEDEMPGAQFISDPIFVDFIFEDIDRGKELSLINYVILSSRPNFGEVYLADNLPEDILSTELPRIRMAIQSYRDTTT